MLVSTSLSFAIIRPYKVNYFNAIDGFLLSILGFLHLICQFVLYLSNQKNIHKVRVGGLHMKDSRKDKLILFSLVVLVSQFHHCLALLITCSSRKGKGMYMPTLNSHGEVRRSCTCTSARALNDGLVHCNSEWLVQILWDLIANYTFEVSGYNHWTGLATTGLDY